jgi:hypothetical protein
MHGMVGVLYKKQDVMSDLLAVIHRKVNANRNSENLTCILSASCTQWIGIGYNTITPILRHETLSKDDY